METLQGTLTQPIRTQGRQPVRSETAWRDEVERKAALLTVAAESNREKALSIHRFVRDEIRFGLDVPQRAPHEVLERGIGFSLTKCRLHAALLRAAGLEARFRIAAVNREFLRPMLPHGIFRWVPVRIGFHAFVECLLDNEWVACDTLFDRALYGALIRNCLLTRAQLPSIHWDGYSDLNMLAFWTLEDLGVSNSLNDQIRQASQTLPPGPVGHVALWLANRHIAETRSA